MFDTYSDIITEVIVGTEHRAREHGFRLNITGGSQQSCSTYFSLRREREDEAQELAVRISDHSHRSAMSEVNFHVGLFSDHGYERILANTVYERDVFELDDDEEVISHTQVRCEENDEEAERIGFEVADAEIARIASAIVSAALTREWE